MFLKRVSLATLSVSTTMLISKVLSEMVLNVVGEDFGTVNDDADLKSKIIAATKVVGVAVTISVVSGMIAGQVTRFADQTLWSESVLDIKTE